MKRGREYQSCGEECNVEINLSYNFKAVGKNIKWGRGEGDANLGAENQDLKKNMGGEEY